MGLESTTFLDGLVTTNPVSSDTVAQGDDHLRLVKSVLKASFPSIAFARYLEQPRANLASASTPDIGATTTNYVNVTGTTTITGFVGNFPGMTKLVRFNAALQLTHHADNFPLIGAANITTVANDHGLFVCTGENIWQLIAYIRATGKALVETDPFPSQTDNSGKALHTNGSSVSWSFNPPIGLIAYWPAETPPTNWLECNGAAISRTTYAALFAGIGTSFGAGDGSTTFNIPDLRGEFIRGWDHGAGRDPNAGARTTSGGGVTGDHVGSKQADEFESHGHPYQASYNNNTDSDSSGGLMVNDTNTTLSGAHNGAPGNTAGTQIGASGGNETRPRNVYMMPIIRVL